MTLFEIEPNGAAVYRFDSAVWTVPAATTIREVVYVERFLRSRDITYVRRETR